jgi:hypothetical protein
MSSWCYARDRMVRVQDSIFCVIPATFSMWFFYTLDERLDIRVYICKWLVMPLLIGSVYRKSETAIFLVLEEQLFLVHNFTQPTTHNWVTCHQNCFEESIHVLVYKAEKTISGTAIRMVEISANWKSFTTARWELRIKSRMHITTELRWNRLPIWMKYHCIMWNWYLWELAG